MEIDAGKINNIPALIQEIADNISLINFEIGIVIPCLNESGIICLLENILDNYPAQSSIIIFVNVNSSANSTLEIQNNNKKIYNQIKNFSQKYNNKYINIFPINIFNIPEKLAGVGFARKIGMDTLNYIYSKKSKDGIIISLDADCKVEKNYLIEIENAFNKNKDAKTVIIHFEHPLEGKEFTDEIYKAVALYELHLRYHIEKLKYIQFPYPYHTIGSCFAIRSSIYKKSGGMNTRKAGEDFYFLHKVFPLGKVIELNTTCVYPSPRISDRVPFGTGPAIKEIIKNNLNFTTYNPKAYENLKKMFESLNFFYEEKINHIYSTLDESLQKFLLNNNFSEKIKEIKKNTSSFNTFYKRFFHWFNAFKIIKYLNFAHFNNYYKKINVIEAVAGLINDKSVTSEDYKTVLKILREKQKKI